MSHRPAAVRAVLALAIAATVGACAGGKTREAAGLPTTFPALSPADAAAVTAIRDEGMNHSKIAETADYLCNVIGPRITASPAVRRANDWSRDTLTQWGLADAHLEPWGPFGLGWTLKRFSFQVTDPYVFTPIAYPKAWTPGFDAPIDAPVVYLDTKSEAGLAEYKDKVKGAIVLIGQPRVLDAGFEAKATRRTDEQLATLAKGGSTSRPTELLQSTTAPAGGATTIVADASAEPATQSTGRSTSRPTTRRARRRPVTPDTELGAIAFAAKALKFAADNDAAMVVTPSTTGDGGTVFVAQAALADTTPRKGPNKALPATMPRVWWPDSVVKPAQVMTSAEDFNRLVSIARHDVPIKAAVDLQVNLTKEMPQQYNTVAELPGTDLADQIVMVGGHMDSWHSATGATDNAAGTVAAMEAVRILKASGVKTRRTIRVALWTGEEEGLHGSSFYVRSHFGTLSTDPINNPKADAAMPGTTPTTGPATQPDASEKLTVSNITATQPATKPASVVKAGPEYDQFSVYFNLDNGTGKIRGIYAQQNKAAVPVFQRWLAPLHDLGAATVAPGNTGSTDHVTFDRIGLPGFQFIQDPIEYFPRTHHSNQDTYDRLQLDDLKQAATVMATFLYDAANADEAFPRKPLTP